MKSKPDAPPLARSADREVLDWNLLEPADPPGARDVLGLSPQDRLALGLSPPARTMQAHPAVVGDAHAALAEALARGAAVGPRERRQRR